MWEICLIDRLKYYSCFYLTFFKHQHDISWRKKYDNKFEEVPEAAFSDKTSWAFASSSIPPLWGHWWPTASGLASQQYFTFVQSFSVVSVKKNTQRTDKKNALCKKENVDNL